MSQALLWDSPPEEGRSRTIPRSPIRASFADRDAQCGSVHVWQLAWLSLVLGLKKIIQEVCNVLGCSLLTVPCCEDVFKMLCPCFDIGYSPCFDF